jgi:hypothetical protein
MEIYDMTHSPEPESKTKTIAKTIAAFAGTVVGTATAEMMLKQLAKAPTGVQVVIVAAATALVAKNQLDNNS